MNKKTAWKILGEPAFGIGFFLLIQSALLLIFGVYISRSGFYSVKEPLLWGGIWLLAGTLLFVWGYKKLEK